MTAHLYCWPQLVKTEADRTVNDGPPRLLTTACENWGRPDGQWRHTSTADHSLWKLRPTGWSMTAHLYCWPQLVKTEADRMVNDGTPLLLTTACENWGWPDGQWRPTSTADHSLWKQADRMVNDGTPLLLTTACENWGRPDGQWRHTSTADHSLWKQADRMVNDGTPLLLTTACENWGRPDGQWRHTSTADHSLWKLRPTGWSMTAHLYCWPQLVKTEADRMVNDGPPLLLTTACENRPTGWSMTAHLYCWPQLVKTEADRMVNDGTPLLLTTACENRPTGWSMTAHLYCWPQLVKTGRPDGQWRHTSTADHSLWKLRPTGWSMTAHLYCWPQLVKTGRPDGQWRHTSTADHSLWKLRPTGWSMTAHLYCWPQLVKTEADRMVNDGTPLLLTTACENWGRPDGQWRHTSTADHSLWKLRPTGWSMTAHLYCWPQLVKTEADRMVNDGTPLLLTTACENWGRPDGQWWHTSTADHSLWKQADRMVNDGTPLLLTTACENWGRPDGQWRHTSTADHSLWKLRLTGWSMTAHLYCWPQLVKTEADRMVNDGTPLLLTTACEN